MKLRKLLVVMLTMLLLCSMLPMTATVSAAANMLANGDFEQGDANWTELVETVEVPRLFFLNLSLDTTGGVAAG